MSLTEIIFSAVAMSQVANDSQAGLPNEAIGDALFFFLTIIGLFLEAFLLKTSLELTYFHVRLWHKTTITGRHHSTLNWHGNDFISEHEIGLVESIIWQWALQASLSDETTKPTSLDEDHNVNEAVRRTGNQLKDVVGRRMTAGHNMDSVVRTSYQRTEKLVYHKFLARGKRAVASRAEERSLVESDASDRNRVRVPSSVQQRERWQTHPYTSSALWCAGQDVELKQETRRVMRKVREQQEHQRAIENAKREAGNLRASSQPKQWAAIQSEVDAMRTQAESLRRTTAGGDRAEELEHAADQLESTLRDRSDAISDDQKIMERFGIGEVELEQYQEAFVLFDQSGTGAIGTADLKLALAGIGVSALAEADTYADDLLAALDLSDTDAISLEEFITMLVSRARYHQDTERDLREIYTRLQSKCGSKTMTKVDLKDLLQKHDNRYQADVTVYNPHQADLDSDWESIWDIHDRDGDGVLSCEEFLEAVGTAPVKDEPDRHHGDVTDVQTTVISI